MSVSLSLRGTAEVVGGPGGVLASSSAVRRSGRSSRAPVLPPFTRCITSALTSFSATSHARLSSLRILLHSERYLQQLERAEQRRTQSDAWSRAALFGREQLAALLSSQAPLQAMEALRLCLTYAPRSIEATKLVQNFFDAQSFGSSSFAMQVLICKQLASFAVVLAFDTFSVALRSIVSLVFDPAAPAAAESACSERRTQSRQIALLEGFRAALGEAPVNENVRTVLWNALLGDIACRIGCHLVSARRVGNERQHALVELFVRCFSCLSVVALQELLVLHEARGDNSSCRSSVFLLLRLSALSTSEAESPPSATAAVEKVPRASSHQHQDKYLACLSVLLQQPRLDPFLHVFSNSIARIGSVLRLPLLLHVLELAPLARSPSNALCVLSTVCGSSSLSSDRILVRTSESPTSLLLALPRLLSQFLEHCDDLTVDVVIHRLFLLLDASDSRAAVAASLLAIAQRFPARCAATVLEKLHSSFSFPLPTYLVAELRTCCNTLD